jgi:predicted aspartyl protease
MLKSVLAAACAIMWLTVSAQFPTGKNVLSFGGIESDDALITNSTSSNFAPFKLVGGLMFVDANFNGQSGTYILDTGAPGLILNNMVEVSESDASYIASGLTGSASIDEFTVDEFKILDIVKTDFVAYQMDLEHIEDEILHRFSGLIGSDIFEQSILVLDYQKQVWGTMGELATESIEVSVPFSMRDHFIIIDIKVGGEKYKMILDTGAEINILGTKTAEEIKKSKMKDVGTTNVQSASPDHQNTKSVRLQKFQIGKHTERNKEFSILPFDFINDGLDYHIDGLIGYPFFQDKKVALNFKTGTLHILK